jgi:flagellar basal body-associated protein FliL
MAVWGKIAYSSWTIVILLIFVLTITGYIYYNLKSSNFQDETNCSSKKSIEYLNTVNNFTIGLIVVSSLLLLGAFILAVISSYKSLKRKQIGTLAKQFFGTSDSPKQQVNSDQLSLLNALNALKAANKVNN